jgi:hypothetical protein
MQNIIAKTASNLRVGDTIVEQTDRGKWFIAALVRKVERRKCGVHVNNEWCYNTPENAVFVTSERAYLR